MVKIGIIGGSGLDDPGLLKDGKSIDVDTPYGKPSSELTVGTIQGAQVVILARHGKQHTLPPFKVNYRANIDALNSPNAKSHVQYAPATGSSASAASLASSILIPPLKRVAAHARMMKKATTLTTMEPAVTSRRAALRSLIPSPLSTMDA